MNYQEKLAQAGTLFADARAILENKDATGEDKAKVPQMLEDAKKLKAEAAQLKEIMEAAPAIVEEHEKKQGKETEIEKRQSKQKFEDWTEFVRACWLAEHKSPAVRRDDPRLQRFTREPEPGHEEKTMVENVGGSGGFLVPAEFNAQLQAVQAETALVRGRATIIRMRRRQIALPVLDQTVTTAGIPHWFGGMQFYWAEEASLKTVTDAKFRQVGLTAHELIGYTTASDQLVDDSAISLGDFLSGPLGFAGGVSWMEDYSFIQGTGAGQPLGVINAGATITVARAATLSVGYGDLCNMVEDFLPSGRGVWFISQSLISEMLQLNGPATSPSYIWGNAITGTPNTLLGYPVVWTEKCPLKGTAGDVILADWRYYLIGDRQATTIDTTQYDLWRYDKTSWRVTHRVDGQPWLSSPLTYQDGTTQVSPFVILGDKTT